MTESQETEETPTKLLASAEDLAAIDLDSALAKVARADDHSLESALRKAGEAAEAAGDTAAERAYRLLGIICTFHLRTEDPAQPWAPRWEGPDGRTYTASDIRGEQTAILAAFVGGIEHPALRARVADVVWYNDRSQVAAADIAFKAYCDMIERRLDGRYTARFDDLDDSLVDSVSWFQRALQIVAMSRTRTEVPPEIAQAFNGLYARARAGNHYVQFVNVARLGLDQNLIEWATVASAARDLATSRAGGDYPMAVQGVCNLAAEAYGKLGDKDSQRHCREASVAETLRMREQVDSASARAYWTRKAIGELRAAGGFKDRIATLRAELRDLQDASLDEFGQFSLPVDLSKERQGTIDLFEGLTLPDLLLQFALFASSPSVEQLREQALEGRKTSILGSLMGSSHADHEGKVVAETPAAGLDDAPDEEWFKVQSLQYLELWRHQIVGAFIEPARRTAMLRFPLEERHFQAIASMSPFVPRGHEHLFALGFARFWQGDFASAVHLLVPQLENSLRFVLLNANRESSKIKPDMLQEDRSLSGLLQSLRPELEEVLGPDLVNEIDLLFHHRPGPALRHDMAHGKITTGACYHADGIYACWLIYRLTILPLVRYWKEQVAPEIEQSSL